jgi:hypothetical protein
MFSFCILRSTERLKSKLNEFLTLSGVVVVSFIVGTSMEPTSK